MTVQSDSPPIPAALQMASDVERALHEQHRGIFFVKPRVVRRVLQTELDIASPLQQPPHRKSCVIQRDRLLWLVARDELGADSRTDLPDQIILIAQPEEHQLERMTQEDLQRYYWRLMFHAKIDFQMIARTAQGRMSASDLRQRIDALGQSEFDEVRSVLRAEQMLMKPESDRHVYAEFVAVYQEFLAFAPRLVPIYFPSLGETSHVLKVIGPDCDVSNLLKQTRPSDLLDDFPVENTQTNSTVIAAQHATKSRAVPVRSARHYASLIRKAEKLSKKQNNVRAALLLQTALEIAPEEWIDDARQLVQQELQNLVGRLQSALELSDRAVRPWMVVCEKLLPGAQYGFWNPNARLLYDLQTVCFDHEHEIYKIDLLRWGLSLGNSPLKQPLPNQRVVLMSKHLRSATLRVPSVEIDPEGRKELGNLLREAATSAEQILRVRVEPMIKDALTTAGLVPSSIVERVALKKMVHELADGIVDRGFITLGSLRDAISRNQLKMPDLHDSTEFFFGDPLLRADKLMSISLDGVYQRGPFYLRWLQKLNSLAYGIPWGRWLTVFIALPFGLSFLLLMFVEEMLHLILGHTRTETSGAAESGSTEIVENTDAITSVADGAQEVDTAMQAAAHKPHEMLVYSDRTMFLLGCVIFALIHIPVFRRWVIWCLRTTWTVLKIVLFDLPRTILRWRWVDRLMKSFPMMLVRRFVIAPLIATLLFWLILPALGIYGSLNRWWGIAIFIVTFAVLNSRVGRDTEELTREFFARTWYRIRVHLVMGLYTWIVDVFRTLMDGLERVLYAVDEWLRFRSGESKLTLGIKAVVGLIWSFIHGVIRFCVTLLLEPQLNPIKHFPVVTVSHKILFATFYFPLSQNLERFFELRNATALTAAGLILMGIPGVFGFLAWELKENWRLYKANRSPKLIPALIGEHGETLLRLLCPGFHSGTIPRLFARQRRAARQQVETPWINKQARFEELLHHESRALERFIERELIALLHESRTFYHSKFHVGEVELATNRVLIPIEEASCPQGPLWLEFTEQSGWLVAEIRKPGWLEEIDPGDAEVFKAAVTGLYKVAAVDLVREQIERHLAAKSLKTADPSPKTHPYDIASTGLIVWPNSNYEHEVTYPLDDQPVAHPRPRSLARSSGLIPIPMESLVFQLSELNWDEWRAFWDQEQNLPAHSTADFPYKW